MKRIWLLSIVLLAVAAVEFGALGAASAGASFVPGWMGASKGKPAELREPKQSPTPASPQSPPSCRPDREHGSDRACDGQPASIQLTPDPLVIQCDGTETSTLTVRVTDANGRPVADGTYVYFWAYNGNTTPYSAQTHRGVASTTVAFYGDIFPAGPNVNVEVGPLEAGIRIRCFPVSNPTPPSPPTCSFSSPSMSPPCATPTPPPCSPSPPSPLTPATSPPCPTPTPTPCPFSPDCGGRGVATLSVTAPLYAQPIGAPFQVLVDLMYFKPGSSTGWAGYDLELAYDTSVLQANSDARGLCSADKWINTALSPHIVSGCYGQESTASGTLENVTFTCLRAGTSSLRLVEPGAPAALFVGTHLFDVNAEDFATVSINASVNCGSEAGSATIAVGAPVAPQVVGAAFTVTTELTAFVPGTSPSWAGYDLELAYDATVLQANGIARGLCSADGWGGHVGPHIDSGCAFQESTATGTLDVITFTCLKGGSSPLRLLRRGAPDALALGTSLFNFYAVDFATTLVDASVTCADAGPTPTATPTPAGGLVPIGIPLTPTAVPTATASATPVG